MNAKRRKTSLIILTLLIVSCFISFSSCNAQTEEIDSTKIKFSIKINDLNTSKKQAQIKINATLTDVPINRSCIDIIISGVEHLSINCVQANKNGELWTYHGESEVTVWLIEGLGEQFPFDSYVLNLSNLEIQSFEYNWTFSSEGHEVYFSGIDAHSLIDTWKTDGDNQLPISNESKKFVITFQRSYESTFLLFLQVIAPIMACYYLMGSSLILNPKDLGERLRIYIAVFFFVPTYLLSIQDLLPHRSAISFPELLLVNLLISTAILSLFGVLAKRRLTDLPRYWGLHSVKYKSTRIWDLTAMSVALLFYIVLNYFAFFSSSNAPAAMIMTYIMLPAYLLWYLFMGKEPIQFSKHKITFSVFLLCTLLISIVHPYPASMLSFADFLTFSLIISSLIGLLFAIIEQKEVLAIVLAFISGVIGSLITGILTGHFFGESLFGQTGLDGILQGILFFSGWGYFIALYEIGGCIIGIRLLRLLRGKKSQKK